VKINNQYGWLIILLIAAQYFISCRNEPAEVSLPQETEFPKPITTAVSLSEPIPISWPDNFTSFKTQVRPFDINKLPLRIFDSTGFTPFPKKPTEVRFDYEHLKDTVFDYDKLPSKKLVIEKFVLDPPRLIRSGHPTAKKGFSSLLFELGEAQGLLGSFVFALYEDKCGFLWIATDKGLYRYDGENLLLYFPATEGRAVSKIIEDSSGRIWLGTSNIYNSAGTGIYIIDETASVLSHISEKQGLSGVNIMDMASDQQGRVWLTHFPYTGVDIIDEHANLLKHFNTDHGLSMQAARNLLADEKNNMWIATRGGGMNIVDLTNSKIRYLKKENGLLNDSLTSMVIDARKNIWISTRLGYLNLVDPKNGFIRLYGKDQGLNVNFTSSMIIDRSGKIWMGTISYDNNAPGRGIEIVDPLLERFKTLRTENGLSSNDVSSIVQDKNEQIWLATLNGLNIINRDGNRVEKAGKKEISTMVEDSRGLVWIGYANSGKGVEILDTRTGFSRVLTTAQGLSNDSIEVILNYKGEIWIATHGGIDIIDSGMKTIRQLPGKEILKSNLPVALLGAGNGKFWLGKFLSTGFEIIDINRNRISHLSFPPGLNDSSIFDIKSDRQGRIWVSSAGGIYKLDTASNTIQRLNDKRLLNGRSYKLLLNDPHDNIWIGSNDGIHIVNAHRDSITYISEREGLIGNNVIALDGYKDYVYVGTRFGVSVVSPSNNPRQNWHLESLGKNAGFDRAGTTSASNLTTRDGRFFWGDLGLTILDNYDPDKKSPAAYITGIDLFNQPQYFRDRSGKMYNNNDSLWSPMKDSFYLRGQFPANTLYPQQEKMQWDSVSGAYHLPVNLRLPYYQNYLQFHFINSNLGAIDTAWYQYILLGYDKKWSSRTSNTYSQNYLNLSPGNYIFKVSALYRGNWSEPAEFRFTILPPWWMTWWAYVMDAVVVSGLAWIFARYRSRKLKRENLVLENKIKQRTKQLETSLEELKATQTQLVQSEKMASLGELTAGIAHEIQNPLNFVNNFSEVNLEMNAELREKLNTIQMGTEDKKELNDLMTNIEENEKKIVHHGRRADSIVKSMLLHSRSNSGVKEPADINAMADEYLRLSYHGIRAKDKMFNSKMQMKLDDAVGKVDIVPNDFGRVLLNLYNNAFYAVGEKKKQQSEGFDPMVSVTTKRLNGKIEIRVKDNGNGISQKLMDKIFQPFFTTKPTGQGTGLGLSLSYDIVKAHGGVLKVETEEGAGTDFIITIPAGS
jgi:signal transduction histidine kinase/ligand-binding sensor domain-containing protein